MGPRGLTDISESVLDARFTDTDESQNNAVSFLRCSCQSLGSLSCLAGPVAPTQASWKHVGRCLMPGPLPGCWAPASGCLGPAGPAGSGDRPSWPAAVGLGGQQPHLWLLLLTTTHMILGAWDQRGVLSHRRRLPESRLGGWAWLEICSDQQATSAPVLPLSRRDESKMLFSPFYG